MKSTKNVLFAGVALAIALFTTNISNARGKYGESYYGNLKPELRAAEPTDFDTSLDKKSVKFTEPAHMLSIYVLGDKIASMQKRIDALEKKLGKK
jgi:hypothetical protein